MVNSSEFTARLEKIFAFYELSASSFADAIDVGRSSISHIVSGRNKPSLDFVMKVVSTYPEVDLYWLLNGKGTFPKKGIPSVENEPRKIKDSDKSINENELFNDTHSAKETAGNEKSISTASRTLKNSSEIEKILVLYTDGSFESFEAAQR